MKSKRVLFAADSHCGHLAGLTPPQWQLRPEAENPKIQVVAKLQMQMWRAFSQTVAELQPIDILIVVGDPIEGKGEKTGGTELITSDRKEQCRMAVNWIKSVQAKKIVLVYGTRYHTGASEDFEDIIADDLKATKIGSHEWIEVNGFTFDVKHWVAGSSVPHGRATAIMRDRVWNVLWADHEEQPKADAIIRAHVHYHIVVEEPTWHGMTLPALQSARTKYGARRCSGTVHTGLVWYDIVSRNEWQRHSRIFKLPVQQARPLIL